MVTNILLMKLTDQGVKEIKSAPARIQAGIKAFESMGGKMLGFYITMGEFDYMGVGQAPSDEAAASFSIALSSLGNVRTTTLRAFTPEEFSAMLKKLP